MGSTAKDPNVSFTRDSMEYLGYILSPEGLRMSKDKVKAILDWPVLWKVKDIQSFLVLPISTAVSFMSTMTSLSH